MIYFILGVAVIIGAGIGAAAIIYSDWMAMGKADELEFMPYSEENYF